MVLYEYFTSESGLHCTEAYLVFLFSGIGNLEFVYFVSSENLIHNGNCSKVSAIWHMSVMVPGFLVSYRT